MNSRHIINISDSRCMNKVISNSVNLIITSPPYWQLKDYGIKNQIGFDNTYEDYINNLNLVWKECFRVLEDGCRLCINIGDQFARSVYYGRYKVIPIRTEIIKFCEVVGFDYMGSIIWQKETTMNTSGGASIMGSFPYPRNGIIKIDYEFILIFKKPGISKKVDTNIKELSKMTKEEWSDYFSGHWKFGGVRQKDHVAMFPEELPRRLIKMFSFVQDTILDPFLGSGTTVLAAKNLNRNSIGYEINEAYLSLIKDKIGFNSHQLFEDTNITIDFQDINISDWNAQIEKLPYIFHDPIKINKIIDPKKLNFGSVISNDQENKIEKGIRISKIISPEKVILESGVRIRLIGIKTNNEKILEAVEFIKNKTVGQRVFLKFDKTKYDDEGFLYAYIYLKNKTFLNFHLIKNKLTNVDDSSDFRFKSKFIQEGNSNYG